MYSMGHDHEMILKITKLNKVVVKSLKTKFMQFDFPSTICLNLPLGVVEALICEPMNFIIGFNTISA